jgi:hypothetical protein
MFIVCKYLKHDVYDKIRSSINNIYNKKISTEDILMNAIPIKNNDDYWILCNLATLELSSLEKCIDTSYELFVKSSESPETFKMSETSEIFKTPYTPLENTDEPYEIKYLINEKLWGKILIKNVYSVHNYNFTDDIKKSDIQFNDCIYDYHLNIMFIKFKDLRIKYFDISEYKFRNFNELEKENIIFNWINNSLEKTYSISTNNKIIFEDKFINLPSIPYLVSKISCVDKLDNSFKFRSQETCTETSCTETSCTETSCTETSCTDFVRPSLSCIESCCTDLDCRDFNLPNTGSLVFDEYGDFIGMVSHIKETEIVTIPINLIKKVLNYLEGNVLYKLNFKIKPMTIHLKNADNLDIEIYGLSYKKKSSRGEKYDIILSIDDYPICSEGELLIDNFPVPLSTYLWLFKEKDFIKIKKIPFKFLKDICYTKKDSIEFEEDSEKEELNFSDDIILENIPYSNYTIKLNSAIDNGITVTKLKFVKYNKKYLIEINEKIMQLLKILILDTNLCDELYEQVYKQKFVNKKVVIMFENILNIRIIKKINRNKKMVDNLDTILNYYKSPFALKNFIESI